LVLLALIVACYQHAVLSSVFWAPDLVVALLAWVMVAGS